eukprot:15162172-Alexandrium_andersonii.AAC.1
MADWDRAVAFARSQLDIKFGYTQNLPFKLCAVGLADLGEARLHMRAALELFSQQPDRSQHHRVTLKFLGGGPLTEE